MPARRLHSGFLPDTRRSHRHRQEPPVTGARYSGLSHGAIARRIKSRCFPVFWERTAVLISGHRDRRLGIITDDRVGRILSGTQIAASAARSTMISQSCPSPVCRNVSLASSRRLPHMCRKRLPVLPPRSAIRAPSTSQSSK